ncbi:acylphosphatase [Megamonas hypermegale]|uniref:acylphosphatase n=1 Tax=Megamonas hypermegale TaxID=158847 RepID=UPI000B38178D|nr:acylphosphatase [Megamonas hypermegale]MBM6760813.1 acylphosphatase [Megamonas hypermegale]OUO40612.1 acylphosphatase [Megamonas hypermegale]
MTDVKRYKAILTGRVQGVGLRFFTMENASKLGLTGWVKNMADGTVHLEVQGEDSVITEFVSIIKKGNFIINVETFDAEEIPVIEEEKAFIIRN